MKLKAVLYDGCPQQLLTSIHSADFRSLILKEVLIPHLHVSPEIGPAEFYIQVSDHSTDKWPMCVVNLTGVSLSKSRSTQDFINVVQKLQHTYITTISPHLTVSERMQIFTIMSLDGIPFGLTTNLIESEPLWFNRNG